VLVLGGHSLAQAACALRITPRTVVETWKNVRWKLRTRNDSECVRFLRAGLLVAGHTPS
jgi:DNA-binding CsgD family transcriptional regulator